MKKNALVSVDCFLMTEVPADVYEPTNAQAAAVIQLLDCPQNFHVPSGSCNAVKGWFTFVILIPVSHTGKILDLIKANQKLFIRGPGEVYIKLRFRRI